MVPTLVQVDKARKALAKNMKAANTKFRTDNPDYKDIALDSEDVKIIAGLAIYDDGRAMSPETAMALAEVRKDFVLAERSTETLDVLSVKSEQNVPESGKFTLTAYLAAKRYTVGGKVWKRGYQSPCDDEGPLNGFIDERHSGFQVLRAKGIFQLMTDDEIDAFVTSYEIMDNDYFQLCL